MSYYQKCPACEGQGEIVTCVPCQGSDVYPRKTCPACDGKGVLFVEEPPVPTPLPIPFIPPYQAPWRTRWIPTAWTCTINRTGPPPDVQG